MSFKRPNGMYTLPFAVDVLPATDKFIDSEAKARGISRGRMLDSLIDEVQTLREVVERMRSARAQSSTPQNQASFRF